MRDLTNDTECSIIWLKATTITDYQIPGKSKRLPYSYKADEYVLANDYNTLDLKLVRLMLPNVFSVNIRLSCRK